MTARRQNLTDNTIKNLKAAPERYAVADTQCPGLMVRVTPGGKKLFILWKRFPPAPNPSARSLGEVGTISLADAREKARGWIALIKAGKDPEEVEAAERAREAREKADESAKAKHTFGKVVEDRYFPHIAHQRRARAVENEFRHDLLPGWVDKPIHEITRKDVRDRVRAIARRTTSQAYAALSNLTTFFNWWRDENDLETVPTDAMRAEKIVGKPRTHRKRVLSDDEIFAFWRATRPERWRAVEDKQWRVIRGRRQLAEVFFPDRKPLCLGCRVLFLTGARLNEIFEADRREINPAGTVLTVPPERFKSDESHMIQLSVMAQAIIEQMRGRNAGTFLFSDTGEKPSRIWTKDKRRIDRRILLTLKALARVRGQNPREVTLKPYVLHDLRRTVRTRLSQLKVAHEVREMILGHSKTGLDRVYDQYEFQDEMREALEKWAALLAKLVSNPFPNNVIKLGKARREMVPSGKVLSGVK